MYLRARCAVLFCLLSACSTASPPHNTEASALRGLRYAQLACASCHAVEAGQAISPDVNAPAFGAIANTPGMTPTALNAWLHSAHASMPNLIVAPADRADLATYLETLKRTGA